MMKNVFLLLSCILLTPFSLRGQEDFPCKEAVACPETRFREKAASADSPASGKKARSANVSGHCLCIGEEKRLHSRFLREEREFWIHLPPGYFSDTARSYPVIYLLDGQSFFHALVGISRTLSSSRGKPFPPCIIVGIATKDRTWELTPSASAAGRNGKIAEGAPLQGGGSGHFRRFLLLELRPLLDSLYRTNGNNLLIGHSYAGLFALHSLLNHPEDFNAYMAVDPSLWWDQGRLAEESGPLLSEKDFSGKFLYVAFATRKRTDRTDDIHLEKARKFASEQLPLARNLHYSVQTFPDETHGTVAIPGIYDGIKKLIARPPDPDRQRERN